MRRAHQEALAAAEARLAAAADAGVQGSVRAAQAEASEARQRASQAQDQTLQLAARLEAQQAAVASLTSELHDKQEALAGMQAARDAALRRAVAAEAELAQVCCVPVWVLVWVHVAHRRPATRGSPCPLRGRAADERRPRRRSRPRSRRSSSRNGRATFCHAGRTPAEALASTARSWSAWWR